MTGQLWVFGLIMISGAWGLGEVLEERGSTFFGFVFLILVTGACWNIEDWWY
jgi:hypothetical protein